MDDIVIPGLLAGLLNEELVFGWKKMSTLFFCKSKFVGEADH